MFLCRGLHGAVGGLLATAAMSAWMIPLERSGIMPGQPPRMIVDRFLPGLDDDTADVVALALHAGYGMAAGVLLGLLGFRGAGARVVGPIYGLVLWVLGYEGWVPKVRVLPPAHRDHVGRVLSMLSAHLVFGLVLGRLTARRH